MTNTLVVAEKPSVASDIARALGAREKQKGCFTGNGYVVSWAIGHLVKLGEPHDCNPAWKKWKLEHLPLVPKTWPLKIEDRTKDQFNILKSHLLSPKTSTVICATDAGREGELIFRYIYEKIECHKPVKRLWISSLTKEAIKSGFGSLKDGADFDPLADSAKGRSRADWLVGMNLSRAYSLLSGATLTIGRVQTPTLAMLVKRDLEIKNFVPESYTEVKAIFDCNTKIETNKLVIKSLKVESLSQYEAWYINDAENSASKNESKRKNSKDWLQLRKLDKDGVQAKEIIERFKSGSGLIKSLDDKKNRVPPPQFYDLTELQKHANRLYGLSAQQTLSIAQQLYEEKKCLSYPRTDCRYLSSNEEEQLASIVESIKNPYSLILAPGTGVKKLGKRFIDTSKVSEHHAIIPTGVGASNLSKDQFLIYDLVCRRLLSAWHKSYISSTTTVKTQVISAAVGEKEEGEIVDNFLSKGTRLIDLGWKVFEQDLKGQNGSKRSANEKESSLPDNLHEEMKVVALKAGVKSASSKAPPPMSEARLLTGMETAGSTLEDKELGSAMKEKGLGTPATRASIIENLLKREYIHRRGKYLRATDKGLKLIDLVHPDFKSPKLTGEAEALLAQVAAGSYPLSKFMDKIESNIQHFIKRLLSQPGLKVPKFEATKYESMNIEEDAVSKTEVKRDVQSTLKNMFGLDAFRPHQEQVCKSLISGKNVLLVMPTGAGKSLCYQLPGYVRSGTAIIISPLIALMEDQVSKLQQNGFHAESIHSGKIRETSRDICRRYLQGKLDYLFIAPERLGLPGFADFLSQKQPSIIAIDEAHCISQWGHDFRSDYRKLRERLKVFVNVPRIALTATATTQVQEDIVEQLELEDCEKFISGFRRENIHIEVVSFLAKDRLDAAVKYLRNKEHRPAIIYATTRKETERIAKFINQTIPAKPYHAGLDVNFRRKVQQDFMDNKLEVVVATIAFGMGIDKANVRTVIHMALPSSLSNYYQEIGRAGRDGKPSKAILMYSFGDQKTLHFLHDINYPEVKDLKKILKLVPSAGIAKDQLESLVDEDKANVLQKLWVHGAVTVDHSFWVKPSGDDWEKSYLAQKKLRMSQLDEVWDFAKESKICRMSQLIKYFGDMKDGSKSCKHCDVCDPHSNNLKLHRKPNVREEKLLHGILNSSKERLTWSKTALYQNVSRNFSLEKETFEKLLNSLLQAGYLNAELASFEKKGRTISYLQVSAPHPSIMRHSKINTNKVLIVENH